MLHNHGTTTHRVSKRPRNKTNLDISDSVKLLQRVPPTAVSFSLCGTYLAVAGRKIDLYLSSSIGKAASPIATFEPPSASNMITALSFSVSLSLCAVHRDGAVLYDDATNSNSNEHTLLDSAGTRCVCSFNASGTLVAVSTDSLVYVIDAHTHKSMVQLEGHGATVTCLAFNPHRPTQLATASEDRSFKLWDIQERCLLYQSAIISSSPFTALAFDPYRERLAVGSEDGKLRFYMLTVVEHQHQHQDQHYDAQHQTSSSVLPSMLPPQPATKVHVREEHTVDVGTLLRKRNHLTTQRKQEVTDAEIAHAIQLDNNPDAAPHVISSLPAWAREMTSDENDHAAAEEEGMGGGDVEMDTTVLSLHFRQDARREEKRRQNKSQQQRKQQGLGWHGTGVINGEEHEANENEQDNGILKDTGDQSGPFWKTSTTWLIVGTPTALVHVDTASYEIDTVLNFRDTHQPEHQQEHQHHHQGSVSCSAWGQRKPNRTPSTSAASAALAASFIPPPPPSSPPSAASSLLPTPNQRGNNVLRGVLSPLSVQAMAMETAKQKQAVPLDLTASCFAFAYHQPPDQLPGQPSDPTTTQDDHRANRMEYYKRRLGGGEASNGIGGTTANRKSTSSCSFVDGGLLCVVGSAFVPGATVLKLPKEPIDFTPPTPRSNVQKTTTRVSALPATAPIGSAAAVVVAAPALPPPLSLFPTIPLSSASPLRQSEFKTPTKASNKRRNGKTGSAVQNKPVTFRRNIRSSGYGKKAPVMALHGKKKKRPSKYRTQSNNSSSNSNSTEQYPLDCSAPNRHQRVHQFAMDGPNLKGRLHNGPITGVKYTRDATYVATCSADRTATSMRLPCSKYTEEKHRAVHLGHDGPVHSIDWSHNSQSQLLLTASTDGSAKIWQRGRADAVLTFDHWLRSVTKGEEAKKMKTKGIGNAHRLTGSSASTGSLMRRTTAGNAMTAPKKTFSNHGTNKTNPPFGNASVTQANFAYMDRFVLLSVGNSLCLYKYSLDQLNESLDDLRRLQNHSKYKMVQRYEQRSQNITSFANANSFYSTLVVTTGSNRSVTLYDMGHNGAVSTTIPDAHSRSVVKCVLPSFSDYTNHPNVAYDVFMTVGSEGTVKLWDIRSPIRPVRSFACHSRSTALSMDPTLRFVSCVSKDSSNVLSTYDIRTGALVDNIQCGTEGICSIDYSPRHPQMCVGSADGRLRFFTA